MHVLPAGLAAADAGGVGLGRVVVSEPADAMAGALVADAAVPRRPSLTIPIRLRMLETVERAMLAVRGDPSAS